MTAQSKKKFISFMLEAGVLRFGDFITKSGRPSPYFVNTGNYRTGAQIGALGSYYAAAVQGALGDGFEVLFGPAYKGIPLATVTAAALARDFGIDRPFCFNRKEIKDHGEGGSIVGYMPAPGDRIVMIEDVVTAGTAARESFELLGAAAPEARITDMFVSFNRCEVGAGSSTAVDEIRQKFGIRVHALVDVFDLLDYLGDVEGYAGVLATMREHLGKYCVPRE